MIKHWFTWNTVGRWGRPPICSGPVRSNIFGQLYTLPSFKQLKHTHTLIILISSKFSQKQEHRKIKFNHFEKNPENMHFYNNFMLGNISDT